MCVWWLVVKEKLIGIMCHWVTSSLLLFSILTAAAVCSLSRLAEPAHFEWLKLTIGAF